MLPAGPCGRRSSNGAPCIRDECDGVHHVFGVASASLAEQRALIARRGYEMGAAMREVEHRFRSVEFPDVEWPRVRGDGSIQWPRGSERTAYDAALVEWADEGSDPSALELLHRDCIRATVAWNRFLGGSFVLPRSCIVARS